MKSKFNSLFYQGLISISFVFLISLLCLIFFFSFFNEKEEFNIVFDEEPLIIGGNKDIIKIEPPVRIISIDTTIESKIPEVSIKTKSIKENSENEKTSDQEEKEENKNEENEEFENMADLSE